MKKVRVRFAPSPTGHLHIGGLRTALFNWLFARHHKGDFLLRVEDTDRERSSREYVDSQLASLDWAGIISDEPLVFQTERMAEYAVYIQQLIEEKKVYKCFCPSAGYQEGDFKTYDGKCRDREVTKEDFEKPYVLRIKFPREHETTSFHDLIRGEVVFSTDQYDDFIIVRSDGMPVYNFVVVIDDFLMNITHVIRGEDHISNTPRQIALYKALGFPIPKFAHIPLVLGSSGQRLSKRDAATGVLEYRNNGYLADALCNYLVRLGWSHGDQEIFSKQELIDLFSLDDVGKSGAIFDTAKLNWMNAHYIRSTSNKELLALLLRDIDANLLEKLSLWPESLIIEVIGLWKDRVETLLQLHNELLAVYAKTRKPTEQEYAKWIDEATHIHLKNLINVLNNLDDFSLASLESCIKDYAKENNVKFVQIAQPIRLALIGTSSGPGIFELLALLGKDESIKRINDFFSTLESDKKNK